MLSYRNHLSWDVYELLDDDEVADYKACRYKGTTFLFHSEIVIDTTIHLLYSHLCTYTTDEMYEKIYI